MNCIGINNLKAPLRGAFFGLIQYLLEIFLPSEHSADHKGSNTSLIIPMNAQMNAIYLSVKPFMTCPWYDGEISNFAKYLVEAADGQKKRSLKLLSICF